MMTFKTMTTAALASAALAGSVAVGAQAPAAQASASTTLTGCVYEEKNVPGRAPNAAERVGILEDYILAEISAADAAKPVGTSGNIPRTNSMYKLEHAKGGELKAMVGKRVEVMGRVDAERGDTTGAPPASAQTSKTDRVIGRDKIDLPEFEVSSIRAVAGTCPASPSVAR